MASVTRRISTVFRCYRSPKRPVCLTRVTTRPVGTATPRDRASRPRVSSPRHTAHGCETQVPWSADACALSRPVVRRSEHSRAELARLPTRPPRVAEADPNRDVMNTSHIPPTEARSDAAEERARPAGPCAFPRRPCRQAGNERLGQEPPCTATSAVHVGDATAFTVPTVQAPSDQRRTPPCSSWHRGLLREPKFGGTVRWAHWWRSAITIGDLQRCRCSTPAGS